MTPTDSSKVQLIQAPEQGVWRLGKRVPVTYEQIRREDADSSAGNAWSLVGYGTLYCATEQEGCFAEALAPLRPHPDWLSTAQEDWGSEGKDAPGRLPPKWTSRHMLVRLELPKDAQFLDVDDEQTLKALSMERQLRRVLDGNAVEQLAREHIQGFNRKITRAISAWAISQRDEQGGRLIHGIAYRSRFGMHQCWAVYNDVAMTILSSSLVFLDDEALLRVADDYHLQVD
ncbi:RES domain-containing protein [Streptomyces sp. NPDC096176]|uniref:RES domain-containing protein n=1 Tax=Streptomyces sp. NPDC096176 TaxID=3366079 RepID=UPI0038175B2C